MSRKLAT